MLEGNLEPNLKDYQILLEVFELDSVFNTATPQNPDETCL